MNILDIKYILTVIKEGSVNKAAHALYIPQPSLSKCIKRVEEEYGMKLFVRSKGSRLEPTQEGILFQAIGMEILNTESVFTAKLKKIQEKSRNSIVFGTTPQRAYRISGPLLQWLFNHYSQYLMELQTNSTDMLKRSLLDGSLDVIFLSDSGTEQDQRFCYVPIVSSQMCVYLREGSPAVQKAEFSADNPYGVIRLEDLGDDPIVANVKGSGSRKIVEEMLKKNKLDIPIIERANWFNRVGMVKRNLANYIMLLGEAASSENINQKQVFLITPEQNILSVSCLICRKEFQSDPRFAALCEALKNIYDV